MEKQLLSLQPLPRKTLIALLGSNGHASIPEPKSLARWMGFSDWPSCKRWVSMIDRVPDTTESAEGVPSPKEQTKKTRQSFWEHSLLQLHWLLIMGRTDILEKPREARFMCMIKDEELSRRKEVRRERRLQKKRQRLKGNDEEQQENRAEA